MREELDRGTLQKQKVWIIVFLAVTLLCLLCFPAFRVVNFIHFILFSKFIIEYAKKKKKLIINSYMKTGTLLHG